MEVIDEKFCSLHNLKMNRIIAKGGFGIVYEVFSYQYKRPFALKRIPLNQFKQDEVNTMKMIQSPYICSLYQYHQFENYVYMLLEFCPMSIEHQFYKYKTLPEDMLQRFIYEIILAIDVCHEHKIAHSDIKPSNILIDQYGRIKVCDFGLARVVGEDGSDQKQGSLCFMAPEIFSEKVFDPMKADIWALGVTFYFLATHHYPFSPRNTPDAIKKLVCEGIYDTNLIKNQQLKSLIGQCLKLNPKERPSTTELLTYPYFQSMFTSTPLTFSKKTSNSVFFNVSSSIKLASLKSHKIGQSALSYKNIITPKIKRNSTP